MAIVCDSLSGRRVTAGPQKTHDELGAPRTRRVHVDGALTTREYVADQFNGLSGYRRIERHVSVPRTGFVSALAVPSTCGWRQR